MSKFIQYFNSRIIGNLEDLPLQRRIFIMTSFFGGLLTFFGAFVNYISGLSPIIIALPMISGLFFFYFYSQSKKHDNYHKYINPFIIISFISVTIIWFYNDGYNSNHAMLILVTMTVSVLIIEAKYRKYILLLFLIDLIILIVFQYLNPDLIVKYDSEESRFVDILLSVIYDSIIIYFIVVNLLNNYHIERDNLKKEKEKTEKYNQELIGLNETISSQNIELETLISQLSDVNRTVSLQNSQLSQQNYELEALNDELTQVNYTVTLQNNKLEELNDELDLANKAKDKFFSIISHDLKNPLTGIMGSVELLDLYFKTNNIDKVSLQIDRLKQGTLQFRSLLNELLEWARTQSGNIKFEQEYFDLNELCKDNIETAKNLAELKEIQLIFESNQKFNQVYADKNMINTVIRNLLTNAIKFTNKNGFVKILITDDDKNYSIKVIDNGVGMSQEDINKLFRIDVSVTTIGTSKEKGTGLGLIICNEFIKKHNGMIQVNSKINEGTTFEVFLPKIS